MQQLRRAFLGSFLGCLFLFFGSTAPLVAQDNFNIDGLDAPGSSTPAEAPSGGGEPDPEGIPANKKQTIGDQIKEGGIAMWVLLLISAILLGLIIYLFLDLNTKNFHPNELEVALDQNMAAGDLAGALNSASSSRTCLGAMIGRGIEYLDEREASAIEGEEILDHMADASAEHNQKRAFLINLLSVIAQAAPMLGLLGTVSGMMGAFGTLGVSGNADPAALASDISKALITTATGLAIAIPAVFAYQFLRNRLTNLVTRTSRSAATRVRVLRSTLMGGGVAAAAPVAEAGGQAPPINPGAPPIPPA